MATTSTITPFPVLKPRAIGDAAAAEIARIVADLRDLVTRSDENDDDDYRHIVRNLLGALGQVMETSYLESGHPRRLDRDAYSEVNTACCELEDALACLGAGFDRDEVDHAVDAVARDLRGLLRADAKGPSFAKGPAFAIDARPTRSARA